MPSTQSCSRAVPPLLPLESGLHPRPTCGFSVSMAMEHRNCCGPGAFSGCFPAGLPYPHSKSGRQFPMDHVWRFMEESMGCVHEKSLWQHLMRRFWAVPAQERIPQSWWLEFLRGKGKKRNPSCFPVFVLRSQNDPIATDNPGAGKSRGALHRQSRRPRRQEASELEYYLGGNLIKKKGMYFQNIPLLSLDLESPGSSLVPTSVGGPSGSSAPTRGALESGDGKMGILSNPSTWKHCRELKLFPASKILEYKFCWNKIRILTLLSCHGSYPSWQGLVTPL